MIAFAAVDAEVDDQGRMFYEVTFDGDRLGYVLLPPHVVTAIDAALSLAITLHAALHPDEAPL